MRVVLVLTVAAMMAAALLAWAEQPRERRDCATCPVLVEVPAGTFLRQDRLGGPMSTKAVGTDDPNPFGIHEMLGNVAQWVADCATPSFAEAPQDGSAWLAGDCNRRITCSGRWPSNWNERAGSREAIQADQRKNGTGFRVAKTLR